METPSGAKDPDEIIRKAQELGFDPDRVARALDHWQSSPDEGSAPADPASGEVAEERPASRAPAGS